MRRLQHARNRRFAATRIATAVRIRSTLAVLRQRLGAVRTIQQLWRGVLQKRKKREVLRRKKLRAAAPPAVPPVVSPAVEVKPERKKVSGAAMQLQPAAGDERVSFQLESRPRTTIETISSEVTAFSAIVAQEKNLRIRAEQERDELRGQFEELKSQHEKLTTDYSQLALKKAMGFDKESMQMLASGLLENLDRPTEQLVDPKEFEKLQQETAAKGEA